MLVHGTGKAGSSEALAHCGKALIIVNRDVVPPEACWLIGPKQLSETGALAIWLDGARAEIVRTRQAGGGRPWAQ